MGSFPVTIDNYLNKGCNSLLLVNLRETGMTAANTVVDTFSGPGECSENPRPPLHLMLKGLYKIFSPRTELVAS